MVDILGDLIVYVCCASPTGKSQFLNTENYNKMRVHQSQRQSKRREGCLPVRKDERRRKRTGCTIHSEKGREDEEEEVMMENWVRR